jgi:hypothetical protein
MTQQIERWEYWTCFLEANAEREQDFLAETLQWKRIPKYAVESLVPQLDRYGRDGWELVELRPVALGINHDVLMFDVKGGAMSGADWTHVYLCAFKRRLP